MIAIVQRYGDSGKRVQVQVEIGWDALTAGERVKDARERQVI